MCNRYNIHTSAADIVDRFQVVQSLFNPPVNYNVAPTSTVPVVRLDDGARVLDGFRWGLVPFWAKDIKEGLRALNARSETALSKPTFRDAFKRRRCLIPASGYYEWQKTLTGKQPFNIHLPEYAPFAFAGLWEEWKGSEGPVRFAGNAEGSRPRRRTSTHVSPRPLASLLRGAEPAGRPVLSPVPAASGGRPEHRPPAIYGSRVGAGNAGRFAVVTEGVSATSRRS